jgi:S-DNA-T family DNA segregation ATPase FtsK/SpoIIIE
LKQATLKTPKNQDKHSSKIIAVSAKHRLREGLTLVLIALSVYLFIAFVTYHSSDPGWTSSGQGGFIANSGGRIGAWFADVFLYIFGYIAYLFPIMLLTSAWFVFYGRLHDLEFQWRHFLLRAVGFLLTLLAGCSLASLWGSDWHGVLPLNAGGVVGSLTETSLTAILNNAGTVLILIAFILIGVTLFVGVSWFNLFVSVSRGFFICLRVLRNGWMRCWTAWRNYVHERRRIKASMPKIERPVRIPQPEVSKKVVREDKKPPIIKNSKPKVKPKKIDKAKLAAIGDFPSLDLLDEPQHARDSAYSSSQLEELSRNIEQRLLDFDIEARVVAVHPGPVITRFELELAPGLKVSRVSSLVKDLARALSMISVRVVEVIPGKAVIGLEVPNKVRQFVYLRELFESSAFIDASSPLSLALGKDIAGNPVVVDLARMPHLLVSGTTGSGKSVGINAMIFSMLFKATPAELRFIMVDPKMLELSVYDGIPHLLTPVVTNMKEAANAFRWCVAEMERRFQLMAALGVRNIAGYNTKVKRAIADGKPLLNPLVPEEQQTDQAETLQPLPFIVVIVDELSDMMMVVGKKVEELIARLAQKARAAGIHMILATQRPSVDVITGLIKSNIPTRIAFQVSSKVDSRTILDQQGAEQLLGCGDMLYLPPGAGLPERVHGAYVSDDELKRVIADWKQRGDPEYVEEVLQEAVEQGAGAFGEDQNAEQDPLYDQAVRIVTETRRASISYVQRRLKIGYNRAAGILEAMEQAGVVSQMENNGAREVLAPPPPED